MTARPSPVGSAEKSLRVTRYVLPLPLLFPPDQCLLLRLREGLHSDQDHLLGSEDQLSCRQKTVQGTI